MRVVRNTTRACSMLHPASHAGRGDTLEESCCRTCRRLRTSGSVRRPLNRACGSRAPARAHTHAQRASERARRERGEGGGRERARERDRARVSVFKGVLLITLLAPVKHTPTYPASSAPDTRCRRALPKPCNVGPDAAAPPPRPRRHRAPPNACHPRPHDPGPRTPPPQRRRAPARHRTVPRPTAWDAKEKRGRPASGPGTAARAESEPTERPAAPRPTTASGRGLQPPPRTPAERPRSGGPHARITRSLRGYPPDPH